MLGGANLERGNGMIGEPVRWPDEVDEVIRGDLTAAAAYITPAGGAVVTAVAPVGIGRRDAGGVGFTTSLGFPRKLERIIGDPHVALAFHTREHGFSASPAFVLAQGRARVDITPSRERLEALVPQGSVISARSCAGGCGTGCCVSITLSGFSWISPLRGWWPGRIWAPPARWG